MASYVTISTSAVATLLCDGESVHRGAVRCASCRNADIRTGTLDAALGTLRCERCFIRRRLRCSSAKLTRLAVAWPRSCQCQEAQPPASTPRRRSRPGNRTSGCRLARANLPFVDRSAAAFGLDAVLGRQMFGEQSMWLGIVAEQRQAPTIAHRHSQAGMDERLPVVRVVDDVANGPLALDVRHPPVVSDAIARLPLVLGERLARRTDESTVAGHDDTGVRRLPAELVDDIG